MLFGIRTNDRVRSIATTEGSQLISGTAQAYIFGLKHLRVIFHICTTPKCGKKKPVTVTGALKRNILGRWILSISIIGAFLNSNFHPSYRRFPFSRKDYPEQDHSIPIGARDRS